MVRIIIRHKNSRPQSGKLSDYFLTLIYCMYLIAVLSFSIYFLNHIHHNRNHRTRKSYAHFIRDQFHSFFYLQSCCPAGRMEEETMRKRIDHRCSGLSASKITTTTGPATAWINDGKFLSSFCSRSFSVT